MKKVSKAKHAKTTPSALTAEQQAKADTYITKYGKDSLVHYMQNQEISADENTYLECVKYFVSKGADVNAKTDHGVTPLHWAAGRNPNVEVAKCLVENGAGIRAEDDQGCTPLDVAFRLAKSAEVGLYFLELMAGRKGVEVTDPAVLAKIKWQ